MLTRIDSIHPLLGPTQNRQKRAEPFILQRNPFRESSEGSVEFVGRLG
jgi:hypothetical protein